MEESRRRWRVTIAIAALFIAGCGPSGSAASSSSATASETPSIYATPPARTGAAMAYDVGQHQLVMYGGVTELGQAAGLNDTWAWDGKGWIQLKPHTIPTIQNPSMAYDAAKGALLMVGSEVTGQTRRNSLWSWQGGDWVQLFDWTSPDCGKTCPPSTALPFAAGALTYDSVHGRTLMLTGAPAGPGDETWAWDGAKWSQIRTTHRPTLISCCVSPDGATGRLLALGFYFNWGGIHRLWVFDGTDWSLTATSTPTGNVMMIDDPSTDRPLLVRSTDINGSPSPGTWSWNGSAWQKLEVTSPPGLTASSLGYDAANKDVIVFGGRDGYGNAVSDTWVWNGRAWNKQP